MIKRRTHQKKSPDLSGIADILGRTTNIGDPNYQDIDSATRNFREPGEFIPGSPTSGQMQTDSSYSDLLNQLQGLYGSDLASLLSQFGIKDPNSLNTSQRDDWNKQLLDTLLQYVMTQENRSYNESLRNEQRVYDSPTNQLARLMAAGISRDAAIQLLHASGSGGVSVPYSDPAAAAEGIPASQSSLNGTQRVTSVFGAIAQIAGVIGSLGTFGMSAAQLSTNIAASKAATAGQLLQNSQLSKTLAGIETASTVIGAISSASQAGIVPKDYNFTSSQDMLKYIRDNADKYEPFSNLVKSGALDGIAKDVYSLDALNHGYESWRKTRDYNVDRKHIIRMQGIQELFGQLNNDKISSEIESNKQGIQESIQRMISNNLRLGNETNMTLAQVGLINEQVNALNISNDVQGVDRDWYLANIEDINTSRRGQLMIDAAGWHAIMDNPTMLQKEVTAWLADKDNARTAAALENIYLSDEYDTQVEMRTPGGDSYGLRQMALTFHNLFTFALGQPNASKDEARSLGKLAKSAACLYLFRHP